jgi:hypothetical protein
LRPAGAKVSKTPILKKSQAQCYTPVVSASQKEETGRSLGKVGQAKA